MLAFPAVIDVWVNLSLYLKEKGHNSYTVISVSIILEIHVKTSEISLYIH